MSRVRNAPGYGFKVRQKRLRIRREPGMAEGFHSPPLSREEKARLRASVDKGEA